MVRPSRFQAKTEALNSSQKCRHWPIGLIFDYLHANNIQSQNVSQVGTSPSYFAISPSQPQPVQPAQLQPLKVTLHIQNPPSEKLLMTPSIESCKTNFMNQLKEADFVRWGSVKRITSLRKLDQDALWAGVLSLESPAKYVCVWSS